MKINMEVDINPFEIPTGVTIVNKVAGSRADVLKPRQVILLNELPKDVLEALCDDFKTRVMAARRAYMDKCIRDDDPT